MVSIGHQAHQPDRTYQNITIDFQIYLKTNKVEIQFDSLVYFDVLVFVHRVCIKGVVTSWVPSVRLTVHSDLRKYNGGCRTSFCISLFSL